MVAPNAAGLKYAIRMDDGQAAAALRRFEGKSAATSAKVKRDFGGINGSAAKLTAVIGRLGIGLGALSGLTFTGLVAGLRASARAIADIGAEAATAGVGVEAYQELTFAAEQYRISSESLTDGLKELQLRADEFVKTGKGSGAEAFARLGFSAKDLAEKLKKPDELFEEIIERLRTLDKAAQIRVADEIFGGTGGEQFVRLLDDGVKSIKDLRKEAREAGGVLDQEFIDKAADIDREFAKIERRIGVGIKGAIVAAAQQLGAFLDSFNSVQKQQTSTFQTQAATFRDLLQRQERMAESGRFFSDFAQRRAARTREDLEGVDRLLQSRAIEKANRSLAGKVIEVPFTPIEIDPPGSGGNGSGRSKGSSSRSTASRTASARGADREAQAISRVIEQLKFEEQQLGRTDIEKKVYNQLKRAGVDANSAAGRQIVSLVRNIEAEKAALEASEEAWRAREFAIEDQKEALRDVLGTFSDGIRNAETAMEIFGSVFDQVADRVINSGLDTFVDGLFSNKGGLFGGGLFGGGLFGGGLSASSAALSLFNAGHGGLFAQGGISNRPAIFGEAGPEAAVPLPDGRTIPVTLTAPAGFNRMLTQLEGLGARNNRAGGGEIVVTFANSADSRGNIRSFVESVSSNIADQKISVVERDRPQFEQERAARA